MFDLIIRGGTLVGDAGLMRADLAVADGRIAEVGPDLEGGARTEIDAGGLHLFPGVIDAHVHCNEPGRTDWEGFATATAGLAAGGATTFFDMPLNAHPPTVDVGAFAAKLVAAQAASQIDFALWGGLIPGNRDQLAPLAERGVIGFKAFMSASGTDDFPAADDLTLYEGMAEAAGLGRIVAVHAENDRITGELARRAQAAGRTGVRDYLHSRPIVTELEAITRAITFAEETGCALHIVHVSSGGGVALVAAARARGVDVSCETCPHYLVFSEEDAEVLGAVAKCAPPLRPQSEIAALWGYLRDGTLPMVASDHSPAPPGMKGLGDRGQGIGERGQGIGDKGQGTGDRGTSSDPVRLDTAVSPYSLSPLLNPHSPNAANFFQIWGGISSCQSTLQVMLTEGYARRGIGLELIAAATAGFVARRWGLAPRKGGLAVGADADIAIVDLGAEGTLAPTDLFYRHQHSPYVGRTLRGRVVRTLLRGATVFRDGTIVGEARGRLVLPG